MRIAQIFRIMRILKKSSEASHITGMQTLGMTLKNRSVTENYKESILSNVIILSKLSQPNETQDIVCKYNFILN